MHDLKERVDEETGKKVKFEKEKKLAAGLQRKNAMPFQDYVDRDVSHIKGDTGEFSRTAATSRGLKPLDTKTDNKDGLFASLAKEPGPPVPYAEQQRKQQFAQAAVTDGRYGHKELRQTDSHLPEYMKVARRAQLEK